MISSLKNLNWHNFLARPRLPAPPAEALDALGRQTTLITGADGPAVRARAQQGAAEVAL